MILLAALREKRGWKAGQVLEVEETPQGLLLKGAAPPYFAPQPAGAAYGILHRPGQGALSIEAMGEAITAEVLARHARGRF
jgi:bifunctional DNA-binding transcriptional regulator/antitoxin component of YhaV-PrlF toxin-antitoxin module